jgi:KDO2-lipid IV(A) lauroyltransferase
MLREARRLAPYYLYRAGSAVARVIPDSVAPGLAEGSGTVAGRFSRSRRAMITRHLARIEGQPVARRTVDRAFASYGHYWLEAFRIPTLPSGDIEAGMCYEGIGNLERARAQGKGALLAMPHIGAWDWGGAWLAMSGFPLTVVAEVVEPVELAEWFAEWRRRAGMRVVPLDAAAGAGVSHALHRGDVVGLLCDRDLGGDGIEVTFFGERTRLPAGPALLSLRTGAPLMACCVLFEGDHHRGIVLPPLDTSRRDGLRKDVERITQDLADALASLVRRAPEQWHVFQPNWPSDRAERA